VVRPALVALLLVVPASAIADDSGRSEFEAGRVLYLKGEYQGALPLLQTAYEKSGKRPSSALALGKCRLALGDQEGALILYREYVAAIPAPPDAAKIKAEIDSLEAESKRDAPSEPEPDFLFQGRREAPTDAPLWGETTAPPPDEPALYETPLFWIITGVVVVAAGAAAVVIATRDDGDPLNGTQGVLLHGGAQ
jgi:tetratricopeptide (TPR) repeat protein